MSMTFTMPAIDGCDCLYLVGRLSKWNESVYRMQRTDNGSWSLTLEVEPSLEFQYRFRTDDGTWLDDPAAPAVFQPFISEHSHIGTSTATRLD